jgi:antitoxin component YwqK of YwqJK toxin-antitoxin module
MFIPSLSSERARSPVIMTLGMVLLGAALCLAVFCWKPSVLPEVPASELARRDGLLYRGRQTEPFTGFMLEKYPGGVLKSRSMVRGGVLDGLSEGWHTNAQLQVRESFKKGMSHGLREKWLENGTKISEGNIVEGKHEGIFRRWHENGALAEEVAMQHGEPEGLSRAFYPSGYLKARALIKNGKVVETQSWPDGQLKESKALVSSR